MSFAAETVFISYSRSDGRGFAETFERRLAAEGIHSWRDLKDMGAGDIRPQVLRAIENAKHLVLILSYRALDSDWIKREWSHARLTGKQVSPVLADPSITRADLPGWMKREEVFDIDTARDRGAERWKALVVGLRGNGWMKKVPYMGGDVPPNFVSRPTEYDALKAAVMAEAPDRTVALTTALRGAGGYGKTSIANALCRDPDVRFEFSDGILHIEIGKERTKVAGLVSDLIKKLKTGEPEFSDLAVASEHLGELLGESRILLVIDDVWTEAQLRPFLRGGPNCVRLVTTRLPGVLPPGTQSIAIDEMRTAEAAELIGANLPGAREPAVAVRLAALGKRLAHWAQMLAIANGWLRERVTRGERLLDALARFERRLERDGPFALDPKNETQRDRAIRLCIEASAQDLDDNEAARFAELAVLPEDEDVPLGVVEVLWAATGGLDEDGTDDVVRRLDALSLLQSLDLGRRTLRLHDNILWYLRDWLGDEGLKAAHAAMVRALRAQCAGDWSKVPSNWTYGWRFLIAHLRGAGDDRTADDLLSDYAWIRARLHATDARSLYGSYLPESADPDVRRIGRAIALSLPTLTGDRRELARQMVGRLGDTNLPCAAAARLDPDCRPMFRWPGLTPPGAERLCLRHEAMVWGAAFSADGFRVVTASGGAARIWDAATGAEIAAMRARDSRVRSSALSSDGARIVTASDDRTARVWDAATGAEIVAMRGHRSWVRSVAFSPDGARVVTGSDDRTARIWGAATGAEIGTLRGHVSSVRNAVFSSDGARIVTASDDRTARVWDAATGAEIATLRGHVGSVGSAAFSPDGARVVTASDDRTTRVWDAASGAEIAALHGEVSWSRSVAFSPDGARFVTASDDRTARVWDAAAGSEIVTLRGHEDRVVSAAFSPDGARIVTASADRTARVWDVGSGTEALSLRGHEDRVLDAAFSPDGARIVTASADRTARVWDAFGGTEVAVPHGHEDRVQSVAFSPDGARIVTASNDRTARVWETATGVEIATLRGHEGGMWSARFSPNGAFIVAVSGYRTARVWDAATGAVVATLRGHMRLVYSATFSPSGAHIVTASDDGTARVWHATGAEVATLRGHVSRVRSAVFSPDGARIVTASGDRTARVWDAATGVEIETLRGHAGSVGSAVFSPDGTRVVTASDDRTARLWDAATGAEVATLRGHKGGVQSPAFSPDGARIVTASDRTALVWDATTGAEVATLRGHVGSVESVAFSPDGARIVTTSDDRTARIWDAATGAEIGHLTVDAAVTGLSIHGTVIALGDALGRVHIVDAEDFLG